MADREPYLDPREASEYLASLGLSIARSTLAKMRCVGGGPVYQLFGRWPRYKASRLREFAESKLSGELRSSSQAAPAAPSPRRRPRRGAAHDAAPAALSASSKNG